MPSSNIVVKELLIYPVKSCAGIKVNEAQTTRYGLAVPSNLLLSDRRWMVVKDARPQTQLQISRMALIRPSFTATGLTLDAPNMPTLTIPTHPLPEEIIDCETIKGRRYGENVSHWLSTFLETPDLDLVYFDEEFEPKHVKDIQVCVPNEAHESDVVVYHEMSPYHLCSLESSDDLNKRLSKPIEVYNFRPNIIVNGIDAPYAEDNWREIQIGNTVKLRWFRSCLRCLMPTIDQQSGVRDSTQEPRKTLLTYHLKPDLYGIKAQFGIYLAADIDGLIHVGDLIRILLDDKNF